MEIEAAVMAPVPPYGHRVPMLLGGNGAALFAETMTPFGMRLEVLQGKVGTAAAVKMCRSVMIKGLEALAVESLFAARRYGAEDAVLESLAVTYPSMGWKELLPDYLISRVAEHGRRRAAEMREVAQALKDVGVEPTMALATAQRQEWLVDAMSEDKIGFEAAEPFAWRSLADAVVGSTRRRSSRKDKGRTDRHKVSAIRDGRPSVRQRRHS